MKFQFQKNALLNDRLAPEPKQESVGLHLNRCKNYTVKLKYVHKGFNLVGMGPPFFFFAKV